MEDGLDDDLSALEAYDAGHLQNFLSENDLLQSLTMLDHEEGGMQGIRNEPNFTHAVSHPTTHCQPPYPELQYFPQATFSAGGDATALDHFAMPSTPKYENAYSLPLRKGNNQIATPPGDFTFQMPTPFKHQPTAPHVETTQANQYTVYHSTGTTASRYPPAPKLCAESQSTVHGLSDGIPKHCLDVGAEFWFAETFFNLPNGGKFAKTNLDFWHTCPTSRTQLWSEWLAWYARRFSPHEVVDTSNSLSTSIGADALNAGVGDSYLWNEGQSAANQISALEINEGDPLRQRQIESTPTIPHVVVPPYIPDPSLDSEEACRKYVAYPDPEDTQPVDIQDDDWRSVKEHVDSYAGPIFNALLHPFSETLPQVSILEKKVMHAYKKQQIDGANDVSKVMKTRSQIKAAKAQCHLLVYAAIRMHEAGVLRETYQEYDGRMERGKKPKRDGQLDLNSTCSKRLEKVISIVQDHKLIAKDVVHGINFHRMVQDPEYYMKEKIKYFLSNYVRDLKTRETKGAAAGGGENGRAARRRGNPDMPNTAEDRMDGDGDGERSGDEMESEAEEEAAARKRKRTRK